MNTINLVSGQKLRIRGRKGVRYGAIYPVVIFRMLQKGEKCNMKLKIFNLQESQTEFITRKEVIGGLIHMYIK